MLSLVRVAEEFQPTWAHFELQFPLRNSAHIRAKVLFLQYSQLNMFRHLYQRMRILVVALLGSLPLTHGCHIQSPRLHTNNATGSVLPFPPTPKNEKTRRLFFLSRAGNVYLVDWFPA